MSGGEGLKNMLPFCVCEELDPYMIFCLAHFQNLPQLLKVTEFNTVLNTRDKQKSSNTCLLKLKEKQQHIKKCNQITKYSIFKSDTCIKFFSM